MAVAILLFGSSAGKLAKQRPASPQPRFHFLMGGTDPDAAAALNRDAGNKWQHFRGEGGKGEFSR